MLYFATEIVLDVLFGSAYWLLRKTTKGLYCMIVGTEKCTIEITKDEYEELLLCKQNVQLKEELLKMHKAKTKHNDDLNRLKAAE